MTLIRAYVWNHKIILPNVVQTPGGLFTDEGPIEVFEIANREVWLNAIMKKLRHGNDNIEASNESEEPGSAILERLNIVKWSTFEHQAMMYTVHLGARYASIYNTGKGPDGMWLGSATEQRKFDRRVPMQVLVEELVKQVWAHDQRRAPGTGLAVIQKSE